MVTPTTAPRRAPAQPARVIRAPLVCVAEAATEDLTVEAGVVDAVPVGLLVVVSAAEEAAVEAAVEATVARGAVDCPAI